MACVVKQGKDGIGEDIFATEGVEIIVQPEFFFPIRSESASSIKEKNIGLEINRLKRANLNSRDSLDEHQRLTNTRAPLLISPGIKEETIRIVAQFMHEFHLCDFDFSATKASLILEEKASTWCVETAFLEPKPTEVPAPESIYAFFTDDLNILKIHEAVCARFGYLFHKAPEIKAEAIEMQMRASDKNNALTVVERTELMDKGKELYEKAMSLETRKSWKDYCSASEKWLKIYAPLASDEINGSIKIGESGEDFFLETSNKYANDRKIYELRLKAIEEYLEIAKQYINISAFRNINEVSRCPVCGISSADAAIAAGEDHGMTVCECGREVVGITRSATFRDSTRIDSGVKNSYEDLGNFIKRIDAFEGKQKTPLPAPLFKQLEEYFESDAIGMVCSRIRELPLVKGKKEGTSIALLGEALHATNNTAYYRDVELIAHKLWGWELADLTTRGLRCQLISDYIATQKVYEEYKERGSSLHVNLRLYYHLKVREYDCELSDFKIVSSLDSLKYHDRMLKIMSEKCGLPVINLFPTHGT